MKLFLRFTSDVNEGLRSLLRYRGDLSRFVEEALSSPDLMCVALVSPPARGTRATTAVIQKDVAAGLISIARSRGCSTTVLANSILHRWLSSKQQMCENPMAPTGPTRSSV
jgi:hypothetical protein